VLDTFEGLDAARHLYEAAGFRLLAQAPGAQWGRVVNEQRFERTRPARRMIDGRTDPPPPPPPRQEHADE
jgi:hypothetical protein